MVQRAFVTFLSLLVCLSLSLRPSSRRAASDPGDGGGRWVGRSDLGNGTRLMGDPISEMGRGSWEIRSRKWDEAHARGPLATCRDGRRGDGIGDGFNATPSATAVASAAGVLLAVAVAVAVAAAAAAAAAGPSAA